jgi:hypothetical protein
MMLKTKLIRWIAFFTSFFFVGFVSLYPVTVLADSPGKQIITLKKGAHAPFAGTLFSTEAAANLAVEIENKDKQCKIKKDQAIELLSAKHKLQLDLKIAELDTFKYKHEQILEIKNDQIDFLESKFHPAPWYETGEFWFSMGLVGGILVTIAAGYAIGQAAD